MSAWARKKVMKSGKVRWQACYRDALGKQRSAGYFDTKREARLAAARQKVAVVDGTWRNPDAGAMTFSEYFERHWLPGRQVSQNTLSGYSAAYNTSVRPTWGGVALSSITRSSLQAWVDGMWLDGVGVETIRKRFNLVRTVLAARSGKSALAEGLIHENPCLHVAVRSSHPKPPHVYSPTQLERLMEEMTNLAHCQILAFQVETGLRWGELMGIRLRDFAHDRKQLYVRRPIIQTKKADNANGTRFAWGEVPKNRRVRRIAVSATAREIVEQIVAHHGLGPEDRLFSQIDAKGHVVRSAAWPEGVPLSRDWWRLRVWYPAAERAGLPRLVPHSVRGSNLSLALAGGADINAVREHAGHASYATTMRYLDALPDVDDRFLAALDAAKARYSGVPSAEGTADVA